jgi:hypothetical protein
LLALKGHCHEIFDFRFFSGIIFPQALEFPITAVLKIFNKFAEIFAAQGAPLSGKWKKSSIRTVLIILFGHLWVVELKNIKNFSFKFSLRHK